jgi:hypothetical protein
MYIFPYISSNSVQNHNIGGVEKLGFIQLYRWWVFTFMPDLYNLPQAGGLNDESN